MTTPTQDLLNQCRPDTRLSDIPWRGLSEDLRVACWQFIEAWFRATDIDSLRDISGLNDMTVAELLKVNLAQTGQHFRLIAYLRIDPEDDEPMTYEDACAEKDQQEMTSPENIYRIEEIPPP